MQVATSQDYATDSSFWNFASGALNNQVPPHPTRSDLREPHPLTTDSPSLVPRSTPVPLPRSNTRRQGDLSGIQCRIPTHPLSLGSHEETHWLPQTTRPRNRPLIIYFLCLSLKYTITFSKHGGLVLTQTPRAAQSVMKTNNKYEFQLIDL